MKILQDKWESKHESSCEWLYWQKNYWNWKEFGKFVK